MYTSDVNNNKDLNRVWTKGLLFLRLIVMWIIFFYHSNYNVLPSKHATASFQKQAKIECNKTKTELNMSLNHFSKVKLFVHLKVFIDTILKI